MSHQPQTTATTAPSAPSAPRVRPQRVRRGDIDDHAAKAILVQNDGVTHRLDRSALQQRQAQRELAMGRPGAGGSSPGKNAPVEMAVRLISETAHDLRSPLASVAATMELLRDGQLGQVNPLQVDCLHAALRQCEYLNTLVGEMLYADGLLGGMTTLHRRSSKRSEIKTMVGDATAAVLANKRIELLFTGLDDTEAPLYVDPSILCRLLVNLVVNAERASAEESTILIRVVDDSEAGVARWSVIDCGGGIPADRLRALDYSSSLSGQPSIQSDARTTGTGLGLLISRQLATLNYSCLTIRSREGCGTDVIFETPLAHPTAVATAYARFRARAEGPSLRPNASGGTVVPSRLTASPDSTTAEKTTESPSSWPQVSLGFIGTGPRRAGRVAIGTTTLSGEHTQADGDAFDRLLQSRLGRFEMSYRTTRCTWVWVLDADHRSVADRLSQINSALRDLGSQVQVNWGTPMVLPVSHRSLQSLLIDRMATQTLAAASASTAGGTADRDCVRLGTEPIEFSSVASTRLDAELRRLSAHMTRQSTKMRAQSAAIRPPQ